jgi:predicted nucleotidyltransferase
MEINLENLINNPDVYNIYIFGSKLYGTSNDKSDTDYIVVASDNFGHNRETIEAGNTSINIYSESTWSEMCEKMNINALECLSIRDKNFIIKETREYNLSNNVIELRKSISSVVSNAWAKSHKKLTVEKDYSPYIAKKSLWHCYRIILFGIQICEKGYIYDFSQANYLYNEIVENQSNEWDFYKRTYQESLNKLRTKFRSYMEKEWLNYKQYGCSSDVEILVNISKQLGKYNNP